MEENKNNNNSPQLNQKQKAWVDFLELLKMIVVAIGLFLAALIIMLDSDMLSNMVGAIFFIGILGLIAWLVWVTRSFLQAIIESIQEMAKEKAEKENAINEEIKKDE